MRNLPILSNNLTNLDGDKTTVRLRYEQNSSKITEDNESFVSIGESWNEIKINFEDSPHQVWKTEQKSNRKQNERNINLIKMIEVVNDENLRSYDTWIGDDRKNSLETPEPIEKIIQRKVFVLTSLAYQTNSKEKEYPISFKLLDFVDK